MSKIYRQQVDGEWIEPVKRGYKLCCCDCGLVHTVAFQIHRGQIRFRAVRNNRATAQIRRWKKHEH